ncbi:MAG: Uma2 family endonuclease [Gemmatimonas sp.]
MLNELPDDGCRYEVIDGELFVTPSPSLVHQHAIAALFRLIDPYTLQLGLDSLFAPVAVTFSERREVQPDALVLPKRADGRHATRFSDVGRLILAVEVLSPSTQRVDRQEKRRLYQQEGLPEYWIVDTTARVFERWRPTSALPEVLEHTISWHPVPSHPPLHIDLIKYFRELLDE